MNERESPLMKMDDGKNLVRFFQRPERNNAASLKEGRPIYDNVLYAEVHSPGEGGPARFTPTIEVERTFSDGSKKDRIYVYQEGMPVTQRMRFSRQLEAWEKNLVTQELTGTPLDAWPGLDVAQIAALKESNIYTVDTLANVPDGRLHLIGPGARELRERAKAWLAAAAGNAPTERLAAENAALRAQLEDTQAQIKALSAQMEALMRGGQAPTVGEGNRIATAAETEPDTAFGVAAGVAMGAPELGVALSAAAPKRSRKTA